MSLEDIRNEIRPTVKRLGDADADFSRSMSTELIKRLLTPGAPEGVPTHTSRVVREDFGSQLAHVPPETVWAVAAESQRTGARSRWPSCYRPMSIIMLWR